MEAIYWANKMVSESHPLWKQAIELAEAILEDGRRQGMERARDLIEAINPLAKSADAECRNRCQVEIQNKIATLKSFRDAEPQINI